MDNPTILLCTTFANRHWNEHAATMVEGFHRYWPKNVGFICTLDDATLHEDIKPIIEARGGAFGVFEGDTEYQEFRRKYGPHGVTHKDDPADYRRQYFRFAHKIFALHDATQFAKEHGADYVIWLDADVFTVKPVDAETLMTWLPKGDVVASYMGRVDWPHSECGFMAFNIKAGGADFIQGLYERYYVRGGGLEEQECHDSWLFDLMRTTSVHWKDKFFLNLTHGVAGMDVFAGSPLAPYMTHHKGPAAKQALVMGTVTQHGAPAMPTGAGEPSGRPLNVEVRNCVADEVIRRNVSANLALFDQWLKPCRETKEEILFVSGGPLLDMDMVKMYAARGYRVVCVKHALDRLQAHGIVPWACVLLDPRLHVEDFVAKPDTRIKWFVASMVDPRVTQKLLSAGCDVWGYHAAVGAGEDQYVAKGTPYIAYGTASATRGLFVLEMLGFKKFVLMGYDLCHRRDDVDLNETLPDGTKKYIEVTLNHQTWGGDTVEETFVTEGQLLAQAQEVERIAGEKMLEIRAVGDGIVPWLLYHKKEYKRWWKQVYKPQHAKVTGVDALLGDAWNLKRFLLTLCNRWLPLRASRRLRT